MRKGWVWLWAWLLLCVSAGLAGAEEMELFKGERFQGGPWVLKAEKVTYDGNRRRFTAEGRVELRQGDRRLQADYAQVHEATKIAYLRGNVILVLGEDIFGGREGTFNLVTRDGEMHGARLFMRRNHFHVESALIRKTGEHTYYAEKAVVTTCDADRPVWSFATRKLNVQVGGQATGQGVSLRLGGIPVLFLPQAVFPIRTERQSGILTPYFAQHRAGGTVLEVPFYWAINNQADATFYQNVLTNRGYMQGVEARFKGHREAAGNFRFIYINDTSGDELTNRRYWAVGMLNQTLPGDFNLRFTLDRVSDRDYLRDFNFGYLGLNRYNRDLVGEFGRDLEQEEVNVRVSNLLLSRNFAWGNFTSYGRYYQNLGNTFATDTFQPFNRLPGVNVQTLTLPIGHTPFLFGMESSYTHFYQEKGMTGQRLDFHPQLWFQAKPISALSLDTRVGFRETFFHIDQHAADSPPGINLGRTLYDAKISLASAWMKDYGRNSGSPSFFRHIIRPEVTYWNTPRYSQTRYPGFDPWDLGSVERTTRNLPIRTGEDALGGVNALTYGLTSNLLWRGATEQGGVQVQDKLWVRLSQSAFFNSTAMGLDGFPQPHHPFSDFLGEVEFYPFRQLTLGMELGVSPYQEGFERANFRVVYFDHRRKNYLSVGYVYLKDFAKQINITTHLDLFRSVKTWVTASHTFLNDNKLETQYGVVLERQCWGVAVSYTERPDDKRVGVTLIIPGISEKIKKAPVRLPDEREAPRGG